MSASDSDDGNGNGRKRLPRDSTRIPALIERSAPAIDRPRLAEEYEDKLYETDRKRAGMYASMEDLSDQFEQLAERVGELDMLPAVPVVIDDEDSLVTSIEAVRSGAH